MCSAQPRACAYRSPLSQAAGIQGMLNLQTASKPLFTAGKIGQVSEVLSQLSSEELCAPSIKQDSGSPWHLLFQTCAGHGTWWIMPPSSKTAPCLAFSLGPKLPESNLLSRVFLKPAQITHPWKHNTAVFWCGEEHLIPSHCSSVGRVAQGLVWNLSHLKSSPATFYKNFLPRRDTNIKKPWLRPKVQVTQTYNEQNHIDFQRYSSGIILVQTRVNDMLMRNFTRTRVQSLSGQEEQILWGLT